MKLQLVEPMQLAHHTNYLVALLPAARRLKAEGVLSAIVVTITSFHLEVLTRLGEVERCGSDVEWDTTLPFTPSSPVMRDRRSLQRAVQQSVDRHRPDALVCTTADIDIVPNAAFHLLPSRHFWPRRSAGMVHYGYPKARLSFREQVKRVVYETSWAASRWQKLLLVNPLIYEGFLQRGKTRSGRYSLLPDPVPEMHRIDRAEARAELGLPVDGRLIGCVGMMDRRRAVPELLRAFTRSPPDPAVRLVLAGLIDADFRRDIDATYAGEIASGRIILIDRTLSDRELVCGYAALDLHSMLQYRRFNLSANVLKCVAAGKPFISNREGHPAMVARRFDAGVLCDVDDEASIAAAIAEGLRRSPSAAAMAAARRLVEFHSLENFARVALGSVVGEAAYRTLGPPRDWASAYGHADNPGAETAPSPLRAGAVTP